MSDTDDDYTTPAGVAAILSDIIYLAFRPDGSEYPGFTANPVPGSFTGRFRYAVLDASPGGYPDGYTYRMVTEALDLLGQGNPINEDMCDCHAQNAPAAWTADRMAWAASNDYRRGLLEDAMTEGVGHDLTDLLALAWGYEARAVWFSVTRFIVDEIDRHAIAAYVGGCYGDAPH